MNPTEPPYYVIGVVDSYGAIHHAPLRLGEEWDKTHEILWPTITHKRWRFDLTEWNLEKSILSKENLTEAEAEDIIAFIRKHYKPPFWVIEGEEWEAIGRARSGPAYEKHRRKWDRFWAKQNQKRSP